MNKTLLKQALKFKDTLPTNNQIGTLISLTSKYQQDNEIYFLNIKHGEKPSIVNEVAFFNFLSEMTNLTISSFKDIESLVEDATSRKESIEKSGNSKEYFAKVFDKVAVFQLQDNHPILYSKIEHIPVMKDKRILAVENGETFLNIYAIMSKYGFEQFIYLSGFPNNLTKDFLKDKDVTCFLDYDIEAIRIYDSLCCKSKQFFKHPQIEEFFQNKRYLNQQLYQDQRNKLPVNHKELQWLIELISKHSGVIEQEILD